MALAFNLVSLTIPDKQVIKTLLSFFYPNLESWEILSLMPQTMPGILQRNYQPLAFATWNWCLFVLFGLGFFVLGFLGGCLFGFLCCFCFLCALRLIECSKSQDYRINLRMSSFRGWWQSCIFPHNPGYT